MSARAENRKHPVWIDGDYSAQGLEMTRAIVREGLSQLTHTTIEFKATKAPPKLKTLVGKRMSVGFKTPSDDERNLSGICVSVEALGFKDGFQQFAAEVRPWLWLLTRASNNRIFQNMNAVQIIEKVFSDHGLSDYQSKVNETPAEREYCVQYRETDFEFVSRLMQEEGIYFFFDNATATGALEKLILCDGLSAHKPMPNGPKAQFYTKTGGGGNRRGDYVSEFSNSEYLTSGKVTLDDFDPFTPTADLEVASAIPKGDHSHKNFELYDTPGHYRKDTGLGNKRARVRMEAEAIKHQIYRGSGVLRNAAVGYVIALEEHPDHKVSDEFLVHSVVHYCQVSNDFSDDNVRQDLAIAGLEFPEDLQKQNYFCTFTAVPKKEQFRAPLDTKWPTIAGLHTATVVGKSGEEIWTDEHGRIKVQFHWDREGKKDENSSCWVRVATPWSGKDWGIIAIPRMGQEVIIQFEEGDPDRPICTGMLYNKETKPFVKLPDDATQFGMRSRSSKGGGAKEYNEMMFEDKKGSELMRVQAQKDHQALIKNKSVTTVGFEEVDADAHDEDGSVTVVVKNHKTETLHDGSHYFTIKTGDEEKKIETGSQKIEIETDKEQKIKQNYKTEVSQGNMETKVAMGNQKTEVSQGNQDNQVKLGNITSKAALGKETREAMQSIELKCGASSIKLEPAKITIKSVMVEIKGDAMLKAEGGAMAEVKGGAMLMLQGGITKIN